MGKKYIHYKVEGTKLVRSPSCPRCGIGIFLANHKGRLHCGKCNYTEFVKK
ncbi:MAG: 30S ribosomal protein S27ae [Nanoarchaeota archaeon]